MLALKHLMMTVVLNYLMCMMEGCFCLLVEIQAEIGLFQNLAVAECLTFSTIIISVFSTIAPSVF